MGHQHQRSTVSIYILSVKWKHDPGHSKPLVLHIGTSRNIVASSVVNIGTPFAVICSVEKNRIVKTGAIINGYRRMLLVFYILRL